MTTTIQIDELVPGTKDSWAMRFAAVIPDIPSAAKQAEIYRANYTDRGLEYVIEHRSREVAEAVLNLMAAHVALQSK